MPQPITMARRKQCSKWSRLSHMSIPDAGETCILNVREWFLGGKPRYQEKAEWVPDGKNKISTIGAKLATRYHLEHPLCSGSPRSCGFWDPGGCPEIPQVQAELLNQYEVPGVAYSSTSMS